MRFIRIQGTYALLSTIAFHEGDSAKIWFKKAPVQMHRLVILLRSYLQLCLG